MTGSTRSLRSRLKNDFLKNDLIIDLKDMFNIIFFILVLNKYFNLIMH